MRKSTKLLKKLACLFLIVLMSIESIAAIVSDSDGAAFVTKKEFEELKTNFNKQINDYNASLANKIDGKISDYLSGIKISQKSKISSPVTNYSSIRWVPNFKVYGKWRKWTDRTTKTEKTTNEWFTPSLAEKRWAWRGGGWTFWDRFEHAWGCMNIQLGATITKMYDGITQGAGAFSWSHGGYSQTCPTLIVKLTKDSSGNWLLANDNILLWNVFVGANANFAKVHYPTKLSGEWIYSFSGWPVSLVNLTMSTPSANEYLHYTINIKKSDDDTKTGKYESILNSDNMEFPFVWREVGAQNEADWGTNPNATTSGDSNYLQSSWFNTGCTWHWIDSSSYSNQLTLFRNMMIGTNYDQDVNVGKYNQEISEGFAFDMSESTEYASMDFTVSNVIVSNPAYVSGTESGQQHPTGLSGTLKIPHWPTYKLRNLTSGLFKNNGSNLKIGQGLPLYIEAQKSGDLQITLDYDIKYLLNSTSYKTSQSLFISLKKSDFMDLTGNTNSDNYFTGYNDIVDSNTTNLTSYKYYNYQYPNKTGKVTITIPVTKGESVWLRISPQNETGGYYAQITNLNMQYLTIG